MLVSTRGSLYLWDFETKELILEFKESREVLNFYEKISIKSTWSPDGQLYSILCPKEVKLMSINDGSLYASLEIPFKPVHVEWSPDGAHLAIAGSNAVIVVDVQQKELICVLEAKVFCDNLMNGPSVALHWMDNKTIIGRYKKAIRVWKLDQ